MWSLIVAHADRQAQLRQTNQQVDHVVALLHYQRDYTQAQSYVKLERSRTGDL